MANGDGILVMVILATGANVYGASVGETDEEGDVIRKPSDPFIPIIGGFVVGAILLAVADTAPELATLFGAAFAITSFTTNGKPFLDAVIKLTGGTPAFGQIGTSKASNTQMINDTTSLKR